MSNLNMSLLQSHEFVVGVAVAAIMLAALFASSLFRNLALACAAGAIVVLYVQGGIPNLLTWGQTLETEVKSIPDFASGMLVGIAIVAVLYLGFRQRRTTA